MKKQFLLIAYLIICISMSHSTEKKIKKKPILIAKQKTDEYQENDSYKKSSILFDDTKMNKITIEIDPKTFQEIIFDRYKINNDNAYGYAKSITINGETVTDVGVRSRGGTSAKNYKRQLKINFSPKETYTTPSEGGKILNNKEKKKTFHKVQKLNLRASKNDPTMIREKLATYIFEQSGTIIPRNAFTELYLNDEYRGVYLITEQIDEYFLKSRLDTKKGALYKGSHGVAHFNTNNINRGFEFKTKTTDYKTLENLFKMLDNKNNNIRMIEKQVNIPSVINYLAGATLVGHWDSFSFLGNNDYLFKHLDGRFRIICWDTDNTFGCGNGWGFPTVNTSILNMSQNTNYQKLFNIILNDPKWRKEYINKIKYLLENIYSPEKLFPKIDYWQNQIKDSMYRDTTRLIDWKYDDINRANEAWEESFTKLPEDWEGKGYGENTKGLKGWIEDRYNFIMQELETLK